MNMLAKAMGGAVLVGAIVGTGVGVILNRQSKDACACSSGNGCEQYVYAIPEAKREAGWIEAEMGNTLSPGKWRGSGCIIKACSETAGQETWPAECSPEVVQRKGNPDAKERVRP